MPDTDVYQGIVPYLFYDDADEAINWYAQYLGFVEIGRWLNDQGRVQNAEMRVGNTEIWLDGSGKQTVSPDRPQWIGIWVENVDALYEQLRAGGIDCEPPVTREFGVQMLTVPDPFGYLWGFIRRV